LVNPEIPVQAMHKLLRNEVSRTLLSPIEQ
jgi:hypothetical protein